jgi:hypothetical protein
MRGGEIAAQRDVLAAVIERVVPVRVSRAKYEVEITWTPLGEALRVTRTTTVDPAVRSAA